MDQVAERSPDRLEQVRVDALQVDPKQPRRSAASPAFEGLKESVAHVGIQVPLIVRRGPGASGYLVIAGHRRLAAARALKLERVPAIVRDVDEAAARELQLIENLQREDLSPLEEARGYQALLELGLSQRDVAQRVGRTQPHVSNMVGLLELPAAALEAIHEGKLTARHGRALLPLKTHRDLVAAIVKRLSRDLAGGRPDPAERLKEALEWHIRQVGKNKVRPLSAESYWGPENAAGRHGPLFKPAKGYPLEELPKAAGERLAERKGFYHAGPCTACPFGFKPTTRDGICLEPTGSCYEARQAAAHVPPAPAEKGKPKKLTRAEAAANATRTKQKQREERKRTAWLRTLHKTRAYFRRRRARPADVYLRQLYEEAVKSYGDLPEILAPELAERKLSAGAFRKNPLPLLRALPEARRREVLQAFHAVHDASERSYRGKGWPFAPPPVAGLRRVW